MYMCYYGESWLQQIELTAHCFTLLSLLEMHAYYHYCFTLLGFIAMDLLYKFTTALLYIVYTTDKMFWI